MGGIPVIKTLIEEEAELIVNLEQIIRSLESNKSLGSGSRKMIANLGSRLINIAISSEVIGPEVDEIEHQLSMIEAEMKSFDLEEPSTIWDSGSEEAYAFLKAVEEANRLTKILESRNSSRKDDALLHTAHDLLQKGMAGLEQEFRRLLLQNWETNMEEETSFRSNDEGNADERSITWIGDSFFEKVEQGDVSFHESVDCAIDLPQEVILFLKNIANLMYRSNYGHECFHVFVNARKDVLDECLSSLHIEKLSIEDVSRMNWKLLNKKINKWLRAIKPFVEGYLVSEKSLADQIFGEIDSALSDVIPQLATLYSDDGLSITRECEDALSRLGDCAWATFVEFRGAVALHSYANNGDGGVNPLTKYVMNYLRVLADSRKTFDELMMELGHESSATVSPRISPQRELEVHVHEESYTTPTQRHFRSIVTILERNLNEKSKLYKDESLQHIFLMNNIQYMTQKVKDSDLRTILGDEWIKKHNGMVQHHAMRYQNVTWSSILAFLRDEGINNPATNVASRNLIKERLRGFYLAFDKVYQTQTRWIIPNERLREDLRLSISSTVHHAYRSFERYFQYIRERNIKYSLEELEGCLSELFGGA